MTIEATQARWQTLVGVLYILDGGGVEEGGRICSVMEAVQRAIHTDCSVKSCCSAASCQLQLLLNNICTQPVVTKISHSGPGQYSIVHLCHLFVDASFHFVCVPNFPPPPPPPTHTIPLPNYSSCTNMYAQKSRATFIPIYIWVPGKFLENISTQLSI